MTTISGNDAWSIAGAVIAALGGGGAVVLALSSWIGKIWANRILESDKAKYQKEFAELKFELDKRIHAHNVAAARIDAQRVAAIRELYGALVAWHEAIIQVVAPNNLAARSHNAAIAQYCRWSATLRTKSEHLEKIAMLTAIYFSESTYQIIAKCGISASMMSIDFEDAIRNNPTPNTPQHLTAIEAARQTLNGKYQSDYEPARRAVIATFRQIIDPHVKTDEERSEP
jgi:hypothetical protein